MQARLQEIDAVITDEIDKSVFGSNPPRPDIWPELFEMLRFSDSGERITHHGLDELQDSESSLPVGVDPPAEILEAFWFDDQESRFPLL